MRSSHVKHQLAAVALLVGLIVFGTTWLLHPRVGVGLLYDDGVYLGLAESLAKGRGYVYANLPEAIPATKYPPLYPLLLSLGLRAGASPANPWPLHALNSLFWGLAAAGAVILFATPGAVARRSRLVPDRENDRRKGRPWHFAVAAIVLVTFLQPSCQWFVTSLMSEPLFLLLVISALWLDQVSVSVSTDISTWRQSTLHVLVGVCAGLAFTTRSLGVLLILGLLLGRIAVGRTRAAGLMAVGAALPALPWILWSLAHADSVPISIAGHYGSYLPWFLKAVIDHPVSQLGGTLAFNAPRSLSALREVWGLGLPSGAATVLVLSAVALALKGFPVAVRKRGSLVAFLVLYIIVVEIWPASPNRFILTLLPLFSLVVAEALYFSMDRRPDVFRNALSVASAVVVLLAAADAARGLRAGAWSRSLLRAEDRMRPITEWARTQTVASDVIACPLPPYLYQQTNRKTVPTYLFRADWEWNPVTSSEALASELQTILESFEVDYVVRTSSREGKAWEAVTSFVTIHPDWVEPVATTGDTLSIVFRVLEPERD